MDHTPEELDVLVVGAGFSGIYQLHRLRQHGYRVKVVEAGDGLGGVWHWATYPGARVDTEVPLYGFSAEELWKEWNYSERYPTSAEIGEYFKFVDKKWDLSKDIYLNTRVISAEFSDSTHKWHVRTEGGKEFVAKFLDLCIGTSAKTHTAEFPGMGEFKGDIFHAFVWPKEKLELKGKKIAVIGTGATGVQIIQEVGPIAGHLTVFQRTPNLALRMVNAKLTHEVQAAEKSMYSEIFKNRCHNNGLSYIALAKRASEDSPEVRQAYYEKQWELGGFRFWLALYADSLINEEANTEAYDFWCTKVRARLHSLEMKDKLAPLKPLHAFGTKRSSLETTYYEVFNQPNVDLVDIRSNPIEGFTSTGIRTKDGINHEFDVVVLATGFDSVTGSLHRIDIKGSSGMLLKDKWKTGIRTALGMTSAGFPNMFFFYSAHAPNSFVTGPTLAEYQGDWVVKCIDYVIKNDHSKIDATAHAEEIWTKKVHDIFNATLFAKTESWYNGANIPGKTRETQCYIGGLPAYLQEIRAAEEKGYEGFVTSKNNN